jgi:hypothetical protein
MKKLLGILVLGLVICSASFAEKYPKLKSPIVSIAGSTPKKLKVPGKINLKDFKINKSGSRIYMDINERQKKLKKFKDKARLCRLENNFAAKVKNSKQTGKNILIDPIIEGRGFKWQEGATPITGSNPAEHMIKNTDQLSSHWMASGETAYLDVLKDQLLLWAKADAYQVLISDGQAWGYNFGYIDTLEFVRQNLARMLFGYDLLRQAKTLSPEEDKILYNWFEKIVAKTSIGQLDGSGKPGDKFPPANHTEASKARIYTMWGVLSGDNEYFQAGLKFYLVALKKTRKDGSSSWEIRKEEKKSKRTYRGLEKMTQVVGGMVMIAEIFANQGYDLYSYETKKGITVHKMIDFLFTYLGYPDSGAPKKSYIDPEKQQRKKVINKTWGDNSLGWAHAYIKRFPNTEATKTIIKYYMEPYGWWKKIAQSHGYGINCACAYADLSKIVRTKGKHRVVVKNKTDSSILIKAEGPTKETAEKEAMKICIGKSVQSSFKDACYVHYSGEIPQY